MAINRQRNRSRSGQAMVEMIIGLVAIMVLLMGLLQVGRLAREHTAMLLDGRERAGREAMSPSYDPPTTDPEYLRGMLVGRDRQMYSADDRPLGDDPQDLQDNLFSHLHTGALNQSLGPNAMTPLPYSDFLDTPGFGFVLGDVPDRQVPVYPVIRQWVYRSHSIELEHQVWTTYLRGL